MQKSRIFLVVLLAIVQSSLSEPATLFTHSHVKISDSCNNALSLYKKQLMDFNFQEAMTLFLEGEELQKELEAPKNKEYYEHHLESDFSRLVGLKPSK